MRGAERWASMTWTAAAIGAASIAVGACVIPVTTEVDDLAGASARGEAGGVIEADVEELALYRVGEGECLSEIAERLSFPGGWRALAKANELRGDRIRAGAALRVPVAYVRDAGLDPYADFGMAPLRRIAAGTLVPCLDQRAKGECADVGETRVCVEVTGPRVPGADPDADGDCIDAADGTMECGSEPGRVLVSYRGGARRELVALPNRGAIDVDAHRVDLDGDGRAEIVAAVPIEVRNHQGWESARAIVIDDRGTAAVSFDVAQWGEGSLVEAPGGACDVLATGWEWVNHPIDGEGMYFVGRRLAWEDGAMVPRAGEVVRRFRTYFHITCDACEGFGPQTPAAWLSAQSASWWRELGDGEPLRGWERGTIVGATIVSGGVAFDVQLAARRVRLEPTASAYDDGRPADLLPLAWIRQGASGAQLPEAFVPADLERWIGRPAIVEERGADDGSEPIRALWIDAP